MLNPERDLRRFCDRYGVDFAVAQSASHYQIEAAPEDWNGTLDAIRLTGEGDFGAQVWEVLTAARVARRLGVRKLWFDADALAARIVPCDGFAIGKTPAILTGPTLTCSTLTDPTQLAPADGKFTVNAIRTLVAPLFLPAVEAGPPDQLVMLIRADGLFPPLGTPPAGRTVMPPAAFYLSAARFACDTLGVCRILLLHQDRTNPTVTAVETGLTLRNIPFTSASDENAVWGAAHLALPPGPTADAIALLAPHVRSLIGFRAIGSAHRLTAGPLAVALQARGVRGFIATDTSGSFIAADCWDGSLLQRASLLALGERDIDIAEASTPPRAGEHPPRLDFGQAIATLQRPDGRAALEAQLAAAYADDPELPALSRWLDAALNPDAALPDQAHWSAIDPLIRTNIARVQALRAGGGHRRNLDVGSEFDFLATTDRPDQWSLLLWLNLLAMRQIQPTRKIAAMLMARDEGVNLLEWIAHHQAIGVERIFVYTNDNADGSDPLLDALAAHDIISLIRHRSAPGLNVQRKALQHALLFLPELRDFEWVLFVDADEFTVPAAQYDYNIARLIEAGEIAYPGGAILLPWLWRLWPHRFAAEPGLTLTRFPHGRYHPLYKSAVRLPAAVSLHEVHFPCLDAGVARLDSNFDPVPDAALWSDAPKVATGGTIQHFWARSFTEFVVKKQRGDTLAIPSGEFQRDYDLFSKWSEPMTLDNLRPVDVELIGRVRAHLDRLRAIPAIAAAADAVDAIFADRAAAIAADPALRAIFAALPT